MKKSFKFISCLIFLVSIWACSTQKDAFLNRTFHGMTAKYNGYFNANELLNQSILTYEKSRKDDFYSILPLQPVPNTEESKGMYPAIDTAVVKCAKVIRNHSMPSTEGTKEAEYNPWIDENWLTIGKAYYYRKDFEKALKNFQFVKRFFQKDPSRYQAELWIAKVFIEQNRLTEAKSILDQLQEIALDQKEKQFKDFLKIFKKKTKDEDALPEMDQSLQFDIFKVCADVQLKKKQYKEAIFSLTNAVSRCKIKREKARLSFILGQLYQQQNQLDSASIAYKNAISPSAIYDVSFNAKLNRAMLGNSKKEIQSLDKMLRDAKNAQYKDQIYFAKAKVEQNRGNDPMAKSFLTLSAFYSTTNKRQKALSYETLGDISFTEKSYLNAQKYYDSCSRCMPENYPNGENIRSKALKLESLVESVEIALYEDSVQRIAKMDEKSQTAFIKNVIKQLKEEEQRRKELEAAKLRALQEQANNNSQGGAGSKWIFNNPKLKEEGLVEFRKQWGDRKNEDDWRRSAKMNFATEGSTPEGDSSETTTMEPVASNDTLDVESLRKKLPLTDSLYANSVKKEIEARYTAGLLYKELLNESGLAAEQFDGVLIENTRNITDLSSAFQLFKLFEKENKSEKYKQHILINYPNSDMANYFKDPGFFEKVKENKAKAESEYLAVLHEFEMREFKKVIELTNPIIENDKTNAFRAEYMLLNVIAMGQVHEDNQILIAPLNRIIEEKQGSEQAKRAKEILDLIKSGVSKFEPYTVKKNGIFAFNDTVPQFIFILLDEEEDIDDLKSDVADFTTKAYKKAKVKVSSVLTLKETPLVIISEFKNISIAQDFVNAFKSGYEFLGDFQNNRIHIITQENLKKLIESDNFEGYKDFYDLNY